MAPFWYIDRVLTLLLDSDTALGDNVNTAQAADISLKKIDCYSDNGIVKTMMSGLCTDTGRGGTRDSLALEMSKLGQMINLL